MKIMPCPLNGPRNISEFICGGEVRDIPEPHHSDDEQWAAHVWMTSTPVGIRKEWWCHIPTAFWFIAERDTVTNQIQRAYPANALYHERISYAPRPERGE